LAKRVLIIEDEVEICKMVVDLLIDAGYVASYALTGTIGLESIEKQNPDLVLLDIGLPGMDGLEVLRQIRHRFPKVVVIILSAHKDNETLKAALQLGAQEYITKPINLGTLLEHFVKGHIGKPAA